MHIVYFGNGDSMFIYNSIKNIAIDFGDRVTLITTPLHEKDYIEYYRSNNVNIIVIPPPKIISRLVFLIKLFSSVKLKKVDAIHVHYPTYKMLKAAYFAKRKNTKLIITFWGSDILPIAYERAKMMEPYINRATFVTVASSPLYKKVREFFPNLNPEKIQYRNFGTPVISSIKSLLVNADLDAYKRYFHLPTDKKIFILGYNGREIHQHLKIINQLYNCSEKIKSEFHIVLPLQGYENEHYVHQVEEAIRNTGFEYHCFFDNKNYDDTAKLRIIADIFINAQTTDALSATVMEHLYTDTTVICGSWLDYEFFDIIKAQYYKFDQFDELPDLFSNIYNVNPFQTDNVKDEIMKVLYWPDLAPKWHLLYEKDEY